MDLEIKKILDSVEDNLSLNDDEKNILEMQCKEFLDNQLKELIEIKASLITKKVSNILNIVGDKISDEFKLNRTEVQSIINNEINDAKEPKNNIVSNESSENTNNIDEKATSKEKNKKSTKSSKKSKKEVESKEKVESKKEVECKKEVESKEKVESKEEVVTKKKVESKEKKKKKEVEICKHVKDGIRCTKKVKENGYCGYHIPKK